MGKEVGHMVSRGAKIFQIASEEGNLTNEMSIELFSRWKVDQLKTFLKKRGVVLSGRKYELAEKEYFAWKLKLEVAKTTREEEDDVSTRRREKLTTECGITLPFPASLQKGWEERSFNFPDVMEDEVEAQSQQTFTKIFVTKIDLRFHIFFSYVIMHFISFHRC